MNKLLITTYRKLFKLCNAVDERVEARAMLMCSPTEVYDHRSFQWVPYNLEKLVQWTDSRIFLDRLIRRLNNGKAYYVPAGTSEEIVKAVDQFDSTLDALHAEQAAAIAEEQISLSKKSGKDAVMTPKVSIPDFVKPYMALNYVAEQCFERNPFFMGHLNNSMAAIKELVKALETLQDKPLMPSEAMVAQAPSMEASETLTPMSHVSLFGLKEEMRDRLFSMQTGGKIEVSQTGESKGDEGEGEKEEKGGDNGQQSVQLLLSHPRMGSFFQATVLLVVRTTGKEAAAFVINRPLLNNDGEPMRVGPNLRMDSGTPPIFKTHLRDHVVMLGGPVMAGGMAVSVHLLHRVPGIPNAVVITEGLYLDGSTDVLSEKLDSGEAKPEDVIVLCGLAGWSEQQLEGEIRSGSWVVARGPASDEKTRNFVHYIANCAGSAGVTQEVADHIQAYHSEVKETEEEEDVDEDDPSIPHELLQFNKTVFSPQTLSWALAYQALPRPYCALAKSQVKKKC